MSTNNHAFLSQNQDIMSHFRGAFNCTVEQPLPLAQNLTEAATKLVPGTQVVGGI
jgi:hypothetical protein